MSRVVGLEGREGGGGGGGGGGSYPRALTPSHHPSSTLAQLLKQRTKPLSEPEILTLFAQMVDALKYLHDHNILHRCVCVCVCMRKCSS